ncbi:hypothetical protein ACM6QJ_14560, partial [Enterococcus faecium]|uniref:hypothetical protein n=1 Tax=Enterococcus faecium TaxID=1352 RepID=UPI0039FC4B34
MSDLIATLPTVLAEAIHDRVTQQARVIVDAGRDAKAGNGLGDAASGGMTSTGGAARGGTAPPAGRASGDGAVDGDPV